MRLRFFIFILFSSVFVYPSMALQSVDSLLMELKNTSQNKEKTLLLNDLSQTYKETAIDSSLFFAKKGFILANEIGYSFGIAENAASIADYYIIYDSLDKAKDYYLLASKHFGKLDKDFDKAEILMVVGNIYLSQTNYSDALKYYHESQLICEFNNFETILPHIYNNTGLIYTSLGEKDKALGFYMDAYSGFKSLGLKEYLAHAISNIADIHLADNKDSLAMSYFKESLIIFKESGNYVDASTIYVKLGDYEFDQGKYAKALIYYQDAYGQIDKQSPEYLGPKSHILVSIISNLGRVNAYLGNKKEATEFLKEALKLAKQNHYINWIEFCTFELSKLYEKRGDYTTALNYYKTYERYGDSILNESSIKRITQLEMQFEYDKKRKQQELENVKKEKAQQKKEFIYILFIGLGLFVAIIAILLYVNQRSKTSRIELKRNNLKLEHDKLQQELEHRNKELATNVMYLLSKNEFITSTAERLKLAQVNFKKENQKLIHDIIRDLLMNSSKDIWKEFEVRFQEVHSDFYDNLNKKFPDLTPNEKKICAFLRLNMTTKDISAITYQSVKSINMARFRLRKKIDLDTDENLVAFLSQV